MGGEVTVLHSREEWLALTETWLYTQVAFLPSDIQSRVVCERRINDALFPFSPLYCLQDQPQLQVLWDRFKRRCGIRRQLSFVEATVKAVRPDILHSHFGNCGWQNMLVAKRVGCSHVVTFYGLDVNYLPQSDQRWFRRYAELFEEVQAVLCEGPHMAESIARLGCPLEKIIVHHLGVDVRQIPFLPREWSPSSPLRVLIAAAFREKKGIPDAVAALGIISREVPLEITVIGDANNEKRSLREKEKIFEAVSRSGLCGKIRFLGYQSHEVLLREAYRHHLYVAPSRTASDGDTEGGAPVALIEMIATGIPVVSTRHCDIPHVMRNEVKELLSDEKDVQGLADNIRWLLSNPGSWRPLVESGRRLVEKEFDAVMQGQILGKIYKCLTTWN